MRPTRWLHTRPTLQGWRRHLPHVDRIVDAPRVTVGANDPRELALRGVVCGVCAARTRSALLRVPGIESVVVDLASSTARVRYAPGAQVDEATMQRALERAVIGMGARRAIERVASRVGVRIGRTRSTRGMS